MEHFYTALSDVESAAAAYHETVYKTTIGCDISAMCNVNDAEFRMPPSIQSDGMGAYVDMKTGCIQLRLDETEAVDPHVVDGWMDGWMEGRMDGWMDGWMD